MNSSRPLGPNCAPDYVPASSVKVDAYAAISIENLCLPVNNYPVRQFLQTVLAHPDVTVVLATPIRENGQTRRLLVEAVQPVACRMQIDAYDSTDQVDAIYAATILLAVDYWMFPFLMGKYQTPWALKNIAAQALSELHKADRLSAGAIKTALRWTDFDEEPTFLEWLQRKVEWVLEVLKLAAF